MDFKPIETKDELDKLIEKEVAKARKEFEGYISPDELKKQTDALSAQIRDLTEKNKSLELGALRTKAARKYGIKPELEDRLRGEDEKSIEEDAKAVTVSAVVRALNASGDTTPAAVQASQAAMGYSVSATFLNAGQPLYFLKNELKQLGLLRQQYGVMEVY